MKPPSRARAAQSPPADSSAHERLSSQAGHPPLRSHHARRRRLFAHIVRIACLAATWQLITSTAPKADADDPPGLLAQEYGVKAGFIYNFLSFVTWPAEALPPDTPWRIGVVDDGTCFDLVAVTLADKRLDDRALEVVRIGDPSDLERVHVLFVTRTAGMDPSALLEAASHRPVLLLGETPGFARDKGIIGFVTRGPNLRLEINIARAHTAQLAISSRLASLAELVRSAP